MRVVASLAVVALVGCGQASPVTSGVPADGGGSGAPVTTRPVVERDYGMYRDAIFRGGEMLAGSVEFAEYLVGCMAGLGYAATVVGPGAVRLDTSPDQSAASLHGAYDECMQDAKDGGLIATGFPDEETIRLYYRAYVEVAYECLNEQGYPTNPPPSEDVWVQDFPSVQYEPWRVWFPHELVWHLAESLEGACSQDMVELLIELGRRDAEGGAP